MAHTVNQDLYVPWHTDLDPKQDLLNRRLWRAALEITLLGPEVIARKMKEVNDDILEFTESKSGPSTKALPVCFIS